MVSNLQDTVYKLSGAVQKAADSNIPPEMVLELIHVCEKLVGQYTVLTLRENEAVARRARDLEEKVLPARLQV